MKRPIPIPAHIQEHLSYDPDTGHFTWKADGARAGTRMEAGYIRITFERRRYLAHRVAFFFLTGEQPALIDHRDLDPSNNRWANLRAATASQNAANRRHFGRQFKKGVRLVHKSTRFEATVAFGGKRRVIGYFDTEDEAHAAYVRAAAELHGDFARAE